MNAEDKNTVSANHIVILLGESSLDAYYRIKSAQIAESSKHTVDLITKIYDK